MKILLLCILLPLFTFAQHGAKNAMKKLGPDPLIIIDSIRVLRSDLANYDAKTIASVTILNDSTKYESFGDDAKDGVMIFRTKVFAKRQYIRLFRKFSAKFDSLYLAMGSDTSFQYIINDKTRTKEVEGYLAPIDESNIISLTVITSEDLKRDYQISDRSYGILIKSEKPGQLYYKNRKF
jgi:hypothetical protein